MGSLSASRLTIFAVLSALEQDARYLLRTNWPEDIIDAALGADRKLELVQRAQKDGPAVTESSPVSDLLDYVDFGELSHLIRRASAGRTRHASLEALCIAIDKLAPTRN